MSIIKGYEKERVMNNIDELQRVPCKMLSSIIWIDLNMQRLK